MLMLMYADNASYYMPALSGSEIRSICTTIYMQRYLCGEPENRMIELPVVRAADGAQQDTFEHYPTDAELAECIKGICGVDLDVKNDRAQATQRPPRLSREISIEFVDQASSGDDSDKMTGKSKSRSSSESARSSSSRQSMLSAF